MSTLSTTTTAAPSRRWALIALAVTLVAAACVVAVIALAGSGSSTTHAQSQSAGSAVSQLGNYTPSITDRRPPAPSPALAASGAKAQAPQSSYQPQTPGQRP